MSGAAYPRSAGPLGRGGPAPCPPPPWGRALGGARERGAGGRFDVAEHERCSLSRVGGTLGSVEPRRSSSRHVRALALLLLPVAAVATPSFAAHAAKPPRLAPLHTGFAD